MASVLGVIPARFASTRLPGKILAGIHGKPMIQWVYEAAIQAQSLDRLVVATDDIRIQKAVEAFGGEAVMTSPKLSSGTDRVAAVMDLLPYDIYVNIQGDEPLMSPKAIDAAVHLVRSGQFLVASVMTPFHRLEDIRKESIVKVITSTKGSAIYFSRHPIPYSRAPIDDPPICRKHVGLYVYSKDALKKFRDLPETPLERAESLEQLRALFYGMEIGMAEVDFFSIGVDTPEDLEQIKELLDGKK
jgi:3-deoxy-manno-octulosonate cytidylyltransferase (CMP-KDO synthetase)